MVFLLFIYNKMTIKRPCFYGVLCLFYGVFTVDSINILEQ